MSAPRANFPQSSVNVWKPRGRTPFKEFFRRIDEDIFSVLYSEKNSRPNVPVNVLLGLETIKAGFGWSDQGLYDHYYFDLQVRYALGCDRLVHNPEANLEFIIKNLSFAFFCIFGF